MGYAKYVGRVGALAVTLGVGVAMATTPHIAYAEPSSSPSSTSDSSSTSASSSSSTSSSGSTGGDAASTDGSNDTESSTPDPESESGSESDSADESSVEADLPTDDDTVDDGEDAQEGDSAEAPTSGDEETPPAEGDEDAASAESAPDDVTVDDSASVDSADQRVSSGHSLRGAVAADASGDVESTITGGQQSQTRITGAVADTAARDSFAETSVDAITTTATTLTAPVAAADPAPAVPQQSPTLVSVVVDLVDAVLKPLQDLVDGSPIQLPILSLMLSAVRDELERLRSRSTTNAASQQTVSQLVDPPPQDSLDPTPNVLLIGVDGTNLSRILADVDNQNFFALMDESTTAASSIVGHTTISNPSWSAILTGEWGEKTGVINNVFTPWTYDKWPTVFNQLETLNPTIETTTVANWNVINAISGAGSVPVDTNIFIPQIEGDTNWSLTDDAVGDATVDAIADTPAGVPSFLFSYFVGVDENGHMHGGASQQYEDAITNVDDNLGEILAAVEAWEAAHPDEGEWTIIVVTDHGHQAQQGFGHGFQSPDETETFVIAKGPDFNDGYINLEYEIVDTTPTVVTLFGGTPTANADGVSLTTLGPGVDPVDLHQALKDAIATNDYPDPLTDVALTLRTIFATVPYLVFDFTSGGTTPIPILGDLLYVATNIPAQIVAQLTGVYGASIFPILPPPAPSWPTPEQATVPDITLACRGGASGSAAESLCDTGIVA